MKDTLKYGLIGLSITPIIILMVIYLVAFIFVLSFDKKSAWRDDFIHAYEISYMIISLILSGYQTRDKNNINNNNNVSYYDNYL